MPSWLAGIQRVRWWHGWYTTIGSLWFSLGGLDTCCSWGASGSASCWGAGWSVKFGMIYDAACMIFCNCSEQCCSCINSASIAPLKDWWKQFVCMTTLTCSLASDGMYLCLSAVWPAASPCPGTALPDRCSSDGDVSRSFPPSFPFEEGHGGFCLLSVHKFGSAVYKAWRKAAGQATTSCCLGSKLPLLCSCSPEVLSLPSAHSCCHHPKLVSGLVLKSFAVLSL